MRGLKVSKFIELGEEKASTIADPLSDCFVELYNPEMELWLVLSEHLGDEFTIEMELVDLEREDKSVCSLGSSPGSDPIGRGVNRASKGRRCEGEFKVSDFLRTFLDRVGGVVICEYSVEVDESSPEDVLKLCKRELGPTGANIKSPDNLLEILRPVAEQLVGFLKLFGGSFHFSSLRGSFEISEVQLDFLAMDDRSGQSDSR
jgi:hypothetical protein